MSAPHTSQTFASHTSEPWLSISQFTPSQPTSCGHSLMSSMFVSPRLAVVRLFCSERRFEILSYPVQVRLEMFVSMGCSLIVILIVIFKMFLSSTFVMYVRMVSFHSSFDLVFGDIYCLCCMYSLDSLDFLSATLHLCIITAPLLSWPWKQLIREKPWKRSSSVGLSKWADLTRKTTKERLSKVCVLSHSQRKKCGRSLNCFINCRSCFRVHLFTTFSPTLTHAHSFRNI